MGSFTSPDVDEGDARRRAENELAEVRRDVAEKEARFNNRIAEMESRMDAMRQEHAAALLAERRARTDEVELVHQTHAGELSDRNLEISALKGEIAHARGELAMLLAERAELTGKTAQLEKENARLNEGQNRLQNELRTAVQERTAADARSTAQEEFRKAETGRAETLGTQLATAQKEITELQKILAILNSPTSNAQSVVRLNDNAG
ncbi:hypothetical protein RY831_04515 [Noviherbaspirillum sp. CPCC 100848]|uniref:Uncharacterized protein n=1 Tax=Noviherbaspirillum album TaxID=3080276 RepID=A0ABU6J434_9BURK|nr:hypothetical protein [Noviherbaspirillum sp. CPCC 100848]MEC4718396.1 hypothetical protein [Noviherbaspirillum sp. CPCC 100848]